MIKFKRMLVGLLLSLLSTVVSARADVPSSFVRQSPNATTVIVFVHGIFGNGQDTWTNGNAYWPSLLKSDSAFDGVDIFVYSYPTTLWATLSIDELAENMRLQFNANGVEKYKHIAFLAHSMGGLVTRAYLLKNREVASHVSFIYFFSTPTSGAEIASIATFLSNNPQLGKMKPMNAEDFSADQVRAWLDASFGISSYCAYEKRNTYGLPVVTMTSASQLCTKPLDPIYADHLEIVKPADRNAIPYLAFKAAYQDEKKSNRNDAAKAQVDLQLFTKVLVDRAESFTKSLDEVIAELNKGNPDPKDAKDTEQKLQRLETEFVELQKKHIEAVDSGDVLRAHELVGKIHDVQDEVVRIVSSTVGGIGNYWAASLHHRYLKEPRKGEDPEYDEMHRDFADLRHRTEERLIGFVYPGQPPTSASDEVSSLAFGK